MGQEVLPVQKDHYLIICAGRDGSCKVRIDPNRRCIFYELDVASGIACINEISCKF